MAFITTAKPNFTGDIAGWSGKFFHSDNMSFMHYTIAEEAGDIPLHQHANEEVWNVIEGALEVTIGEETQIVGPGEVALVPANVEHALKPKGSGRAIVVNYPHRLTK